MEEKNRKFLETAISSLPTMEAPDVWDFLDQKLDSPEESRKENLSEAIVALPVFEAPEVWADVERELPGSKAGTIIHWRTSFSIAAALLLMMIFGIAFYRGIGEEKIALSYSVEEVEVSKPLRTDAEYEEDLQKFILEECNKSPKICASPSYSLLNTEIEKLDKTIESLRAQAEQQSQDSEITKYIMEAQKEKARLYKKMLSLII
jgi:hypothetical protein